MSVLKWLDVLCLSAMLHFCSICKSNYHWLYFLKVDCVQCHLWELVEVF